MGDRRKRKNRIKEKKKFGKIEEGKKKERVTSKNGEKGGRGRSERKGMERIGG